MHSAFGEIVDLGEKYTNAQIISALQETNGLISLAAKRVGCRPSTIYYRAKRVPAVRHAIDDAREELIDAAELALRAAVSAREAWAVSLVLKTLGRHRGYVERTETDLLTDGQPLVIKLTFDDADGASED